MSGGHIRMRAKTSQRSESLALTRHVRSRELSGTATARCREKFPGVGRAARWVKIPAVSFWYISRDKMVAIFI